MRLFVVVDMRMVYMLRQASLRVRCMTTQMFYSVPFQVVGIARNEVAYMQLWVFFFFNENHQKKVVWA